MIQLSVIIVGFKNYQIVLDCLDSVKKYNDIGESLEVIMVDNSPDHVVYSAVVENYDWVIGVRNENRGFGAGNNVGAALARGKYLLFLNPDTILIEPIFKFAIATFDSDSRLALFGVKLLDESYERNLSFYLSDAGGWLRSMVTKICNLMDWYIDGAMYIAGADMFVRAEDFLSCGRFDENIFMYYEEPDLIIRLRRLGKKTAYFPGKRLIHLEGKATPSSSFALSRRLDSLFYYNEKHYGGAHASFIREMRYVRFKHLLGRWLPFGNCTRLSDDLAIFREYAKKYRVRGWGL